MTPAFNAEWRSQQEWGWLLSIWLFLSGSACGLYLFVRITGFAPILAPFALALLALGAVVLVLEQGSPLRAWRAISRISTSWLSRGVVFVLVFMLSGFLSIAPASWLPWQGAAATQVLAWIADACALMVILYPGVFLAQYRSIPFWNTPLLPVLLLTYAAVGAGGIALAASPLLQVRVQGVEQLAAILIAVNLALLCLYLLSMRRAGGAAAESVRRLNRAPLSWIFWLGVVLVGMILPLLRLVWFPSLMVLTGTCVLVGSLLFRYCLLKAGVYVPAPIVQEGLDFSRLNRTSEALMREYAAAGAGYAGGRG